MKLWQAAIVFVASLFLLLLSASTALINGVVTLVFQVIALILGAILISKNENKGSIKALGIVTVILSGIALFLSISFYGSVIAFASAVSKLQEQSEACKVVAKAGFLFKLDGWEVGISKPATSRYVYYQGEYYKAPAGYKVVMVRVKLTNLNDESEYPLVSWTLVTDAGRSYSSATLLKLDPLFETPPEKALIYDPLDTLTSVPPNASVEGTVMFVIPSDEEPSVIYLNVYQGLKKCTAKVLLS